MRSYRLPQARLAPEEPKGVDLLVLVPTLALVGLGIAMVFSASIPMAAVDSNEDVFYYLKRELAFAAVGLLGMYWASRISMEALQRRAGLLLAIAVGLLILVLFAGVKVHGARAWFAVPGTPLRFQPSEFAKLVLVIATARYFTKFPTGIPDWRRALIPFATLAAIVGLIAIEPDMGYAVVIVMSMFVYYHIAGVDLKHLAAAALVGLSGAALMIMHHPYQLARLIGFIKRTELPTDEGYQVTQCLIALGSGGLTGRGYCGSVWKYFYLPAAITDSILAVVGEELGLIATWAVVGLFALLVWRGIKAAGLATDRFSGLVAVGVTCLLGVQALLNIAVATHMLPSTGVPLPFVSYGGSSLIFSLIGVGLLLNVSRRQCSEESPASE
ncbi:MAG: FtsW/RodA/SpoVE family cell cycle protein [Armatimonadota bacterium]